MLRLIAWTLVAVLTAVAPYSLIFWGGRAWPYFWRRRPANPEEQAAAHHVYATGDDALAKPLPGELSPRGKNGWMVAMGIVAVIALVVLLLWLAA